MFYGLTKLQKKQLADKFPKTKNICMPKNWIKTKQQQKTDLEDFAKDQETYFFAVSNQLAWHEQPDLIKTWSRLSFAI